MLAIFCCIEQLTTKCNLDRETSKKKASFHTTFPSIVNISALQMQSIGLITTRTKREAYVLMLEHIEKTTVLNIEIPQDHRCIWWHVRAK